MSEERYSETERTDAIKRVIEDRDELLDKRGFYRTDRHPVGSRVVNFMVGVGSRLLGYRYPMDAIDRPYER